MSHAPSVNAAPPQAPPSKGGDRGGAAINPQEIIDVWSRTAPKYRRRAVLLLSLTLLLFAGLCCFTYWLRTGVYSPWADSAYYRELMWKSVNPVGSDQVTLTDFLLFPISVEQVPMQWVIIGLLLASLASVPILVAILYRFPAALICCLLVGGLAAMPWLGATVLLGCAIASLKPFRLSFRYASALLGLVPVALYLVSATREPVSVFAMTPFRAKLAAPWVLASLGSCVICAVALAIAKLINYRPGGIAPVLALLFAIPVVLFHVQVGRDELEYRILEDRVGPGSRYVFVSRALAEEARQDATEAWRENREAGLNALFRKLLAQRTAKALESALDDRDLVVERCDAFQSRFGASRYVANVLYLKGRAIDMRIDRALLQGKGLLQFNADVPNPASRAIWRTLAERFIDSDLAAYALYQGALLDAREGNLDAALSGLDLLLQRFAGQPGPASQPAEVEPPATVFGRPPPATSLGFDPATVLLPARRMRELIRTTRHDSRHGDAPLRALLRLDPRYADYGLNLAALFAESPNAAVGCSIAVRLALRDDSTRQCEERLRHIAAAFAGTPVQAEALYHHARTLEDSGRIDDARQTLTQLVRQHPDSCYAFEARQRLASLALFAATALPASGGG